ncbi:hypothetical protein FH972_023917 [Carpinus fangiana]|uniref:Uncharacterized protein n=1 Tax=Carpinus fangiana TaxID=176857 RepID=A0A5N6KWK6_9ROSI|nr:hypothetical protein FH972_023917 [Carpinus fangiana]
MRVPVSCEQGWGGNVIFSEFQDKCTLERKKVKVEEMRHGNLYLGAGPQEAAYEAMRLGQHVYTSRQPGLFQEVPFLYMLRQDIEAFYIAEKSQMAIQKMLKVIPLKHSKPS